MRIIFFICSIICISQFTSFSQFQDRIWIFGRPFSGSSNGTLYFGDLASPVVPLPGLQQPCNITSDNGIENWAVATNPNTGELIFYTDGKYVFNAQHELVDIDPSTPQYEDLGAHPSSSQAVAISVVPKQPYLNYLIFSNPTGAFASSSGSGPITYRYYNLSNNSFSNSELLPGSYSNTHVSEGMKILPCETNHDILWLITSLHPGINGNNKYIVYKIYQNTVFYHNEFSFGPQKICVSQNASPILTIAYTNASDTIGITTVGFALQHTSRIFTCKFDNANGQFFTDTYKEYDPGYSTIPSIYDLEFSPNGRFLYYSVYYTTSTENKLFQLDLNDATLYPTLVSAFNYRYAGGLQTGPDGLVYHIYDAGTFSNNVRIGRILQPDNKYLPGTTNFASFYQMNFKTYTNLWSCGFCEFLLLPPSYSNVENSVGEKNFSFYPNPVYDWMKIVTEQSTKINIYDLDGTIVKTFLTDTPILNIKLVDIKSGVYILEFFIKGIKHNEKFVKF